MKNNRLTIYTRAKKMKKKDSRFRALKKACKINNVEFHMPKISTLKDFKKHLPSFGPFIYFQSPPLHKIEQNIAVDLIIKSKRKIINKDSLYTFPKIKNKFYQQKIVEELGICEGIPSYYFRENKEFEKFIKTKKIKFPFILKRNLGSLGKEVLLIKYKKDLKNIPFDIDECVIQPFIQNQGDYRVWILNNKCIGVAKREPKKGEFRTNTFFGAIWSNVTDKKIRKELGKKGKDIAKCFNLDHTGLDIMYDTEKKVYRFVEANIQPNWISFQKVTGVDVADKIVKYAKSFM